MAAPEARTPVLPGARAAGANLRSKVADLQQTKVAATDPWQKGRLDPSSRVSDGADANLRSKTADLQQTSVLLQQQMGQYDRLAPSTPLVPPTAGVGRFRATLCGCFDDCCVCWAVCCCHWITTGQLYERAVKRRMLARLPALSCVSIALFIFGMQLYQQIVTSIFSSTTYDQLEAILDNRAPGQQQLSFLRSPAQQRESLESSAASILLYIGELCAAAASLCACAIVCTVRAAMRRRENIGVQCCGQAEDCCCATFCNPCTQCQLLRHEKEGLAKPVGYSLCLDTAFPL